jgi:hypothetical protein
MLDLADLLSYGAFKIRSYGKYQRNIHRYFKKLQPQSHNFKASQSKALQSPKSKNQLKLFGKYQYKKINRKFSNSTIFN